MNVCKTIKNGTECPFMGKKGCEFFNGKCEEVISKCEKCNNIMTFDGKEYCSIYASPKSKWLSIGGCPMATTKIIVAEVKNKINPLKASKRAAKSKRLTQASKLIKK